MATEPVMIDVIDDHRIELAALCQRFHVKKLEL
jgi:hypothetical protein